MTRPGTYNMGMGAAIGGIGAIVTAGTYAVAPGGHFVVAYGAILVGAIQIVLGFFQYLAFAAGISQPKEEHYTNIEIRALIRSMIAIAAADEELHQTEIDTIQSILRRIYGSEIGLDVLESAHNKMNSKTFSLHDELKSTQSQISVKMKHMIVRACYFVLVADGRIDDREKSRIAELAATLQIEASTFAKIIRECEGI
jgi:uncharacterized membrane protein YebE (DUF533 family)